MFRGVAYPTLWSEAWQYRKWLVSTVYSVLYQKTLLLLLFVSEYWCTWLIPEGEKSQESLKQNNKVDLLTLGASSVCNHVVELSNCEELVSRKICCCLFACCFNDRGGCGKCCYFNTWLEEYTSGDCTDRKWSIYGHCISVVWPGCEWNDVICYLHHIICHNCTGSKLLWLQPLQNTV